MVRSEVARSEEYNAGAESQLASGFNGCFKMTLDLDFANVQAYPPKSHPGIVVFRSTSQDKPTLVALLKRPVPALLQFSPKHQLWIVEPDRIRYREE
jgi:hypothetical protein